MNAHAPSPVSPAPARSGLVTAIAWLLIAFAGLGTLIAVLQLMMLGLFFRADDMPKPPPGGPGGANP